MIFAVEAKGVGRRDNTSVIQRSVSHFITPSLRQAVYTGAYNWFLPVYAWPWAWQVALGMPQEDGSWNYEVSSISLHMSEMWVATDRKTLVTVGLLRYDSLAHYLAGIIAERGPQIFRYGSARMHFIKALPTQKGSVYALLFGAWADALALTLTAGTTGIAHDLTPPWMAS